MSRVLLFTGAGISIPLGLPGTMDFVEAVKKGQMQITSYVGEYLGSSGQDIEWLLSTLEQFKSETSFSEFLLNKLSVSQGSPPPIQAIFNQLGSHKSYAAQEVNRIKKIIFDKLGQFKPEAAVALYSNLISEIRTTFGEMSLSIITTNYDLTFETSIESSSDFLSMLGFREVDFGFSIRFGRPIYDPHRDFSWNKEEIEYLKIHGSLDWHRDSSGRCSRSMSNTIPDDPDQMAILYPGFKGVPEVEPFISMHSRLNKRLTQADKIIVIGFAFRDIYINSIFENILRTRSDAEIIYINPAKIDQFPNDSLVPHLVKTYPHFRHLAKGISSNPNPLGLADFVVNAKSV